MTPKSATPFPLDHTISEDKLEDHGKDTQSSRSDLIVGIQIQGFEEALGHSEKKYTSKALKKKDKVKKNMWDSVMG